MLERLAIQLAIQFVVRQASKYGHDLDWSKLEADAAARIRDLLPGTWFDETGAKLVVAALEGCRKALSDEASLKSLLEYTAKGDWVGAGAALKVLIVRAWSPDNEFQKAVHHQLLVA